MKTLVFILFYGIIVFFASIGIAHTLGPVAQIVAIDF